MKYCKRVKILLFFLGNVFMDILIGQGYYVYYFGDQFLHPGLRYLAMDAILPACVLIALWIVLSIGPLKISPIPRIIDYRWHQTAVFLLITGGVAIAILLHGSGW